MLPASFPLQLYRGDSYAWQFRFWLDAGKTQPADLTGVAARATLRGGSGGLVAMPCVVTLPNLVDVTIAADGWGATVPGRGSWDLQFTYPDGTVHTPIAGTVRITADVTDGVPV